MRKGEAGEPREAFDSGVCPWDDPRGKGREGVMVETLEEYRDWISGLLGNRCSGSLFWRIFE